MKNVSLPLKLRWCTPFGLHGGMAFSAFADEGAYEWSEKRRTSTETNCPDKATRITSKDARAKEEGSRKGAARKREEGRGTS